MYDGAGNPGHGTVRIVVFPAEFLRKIVDNFQKSYLKNPTEH